MKAEKVAEGYHLEAARVSVLEELLKIAGTNEADAGSQVQEAANSVGSLTSKDMEEIRTMHSPPPILRRTLEATWLLLNASKNVSSPAPPSWARVQRMLSDAGFLSRMMTFDVEALKNAPELSSFVAAEYFGAGQKVAVRRLDSKNSLGSRSSLDPGRKLTFVEAGRRTFPTYGRTSTATDEPLTFQRVSRGSRAAGALFRWCTTTLVEVMDPQPLERPKEDLSTSAGESDVESPSSPARATAEPLLQEPPPCSLLPPIASVAAATLSAAAAVAALNAGTRAPERSTVFMPLKKVVAKPPSKVLTAATPPDRHFELLAVFDLGHGGMPKSAEATLQLVASTICIRRTLTLVLQGAPDPIENNALSKTRVLAAQAWCADNSIPVTISDEVRFAAAGEEPGVVCNVLLHRDRNVRDYFLINENPTEYEDGISFSRDVVRDAKMLEDDFKTCRH